MDDLDTRRQAEQTLAESVKVLLDGAEFLGEERWRWYAHMGMAGHMVATMPNIGDEDTGEFSEFFVQTVARGLIASTKIRDDGIPMAFDDFAEAMFRIMPKLGVHDLFHFSAHFFTPNNFRLEDDEDLHDLRDTVIVNGGNPNCCIPKEIRYEPR